MNNSGPTAQIVERDGWKTNMDFVGHRKAVTVVVSIVYTPDQPLNGHFTESVSVLMGLIHVSAEIQPKDIQEEAEERRLSKTQLSVLLLCCRQQRQVAVCLGEFTQLDLWWIKNMVP